MVEIERPKLANALGAWSDLRASVAEAPGLEGLRLGLPFVIKAERCVWSGWQGRRRVVVKLIRRAENRVSDIRLAAEELRLAQERMGQGPYRVPDIVAALPERGLLVTEHVRGRLLSTALRKADPKEALDLVAHAADWLDAFTSDRRRKTAFAARFWAQERQAQTEAVDKQDQRQLGLDLVRALHAQVPALHHREITQVRPHGDFWANNLIWDGVRLTGIDMQHGTWQPQAKDLARFLVHLALICPAPNGPWRHGLPAHWVTAMAQAPVLAEEPKRLLRFFIGVELSRRVVREARFPRTKDATRQLVQRYVDELP